MTKNQRIQTSARDREKIVTKAKHNRDKARQKLLQQHRYLAEIRERNRQLSEGNREEGSNNPTAHSTLPPQKTNAENAARNSHSTVPAEPKYTAVAARDRLYGRKLYDRMADFPERNSAETDPNPEKRDGDAR